MSSETNHILVLRFSAMGDVALLTPVIESFVQAYPELKITIVSRPKFAAFFSARSNLKFFQSDVDTAYTGLIGVFKLYIQLRKLKPSVVIDLHDNIRSRLICFLFRIIGVTSIRYFKGRNEKSGITRRENKIRNKLMHTVDRYQEAFQRAGFHFSIQQPPFIKIDFAAEEMINQWLSEKGIHKSETWFGIAPFAAHKTKIWPLENYKTLIGQILQKTSARFFLFGGGESEINFFNTLLQLYPANCVLVAGELRLTEEIALMKKLDKMICVDSSNMHIASLIGIPTVSIWGGTHTSLGFGPYGNQRNSITEVDTEKLSCRPCSVYGKETCWRGDFACLNQVTVSQVLANL